MIAMLYSEPHVPRLYDPKDLPWITQLLAVIEQAGDASWRELASRVELAPLEAEPVHRVAMFQALRQIMLETERPPTKTGWPDATELAGVANLTRLQRWIRRAYDLQLHVPDRPFDLARRAAQLGLVTELRRDGDTYLLDTTGPLAMRHAILAYGRALSAITPELIRPARFTLDLHAQLAGADVRLRLAPPLLLPRHAPVPQLAADLSDLPDGIPRLTSTADRLAADLLALGHRVERHPPPIELDGHLLLPDLAIEHAGRTRFLEVLPFWTRAQLATKLARYRSARRDVLLCADLTFAPDRDLEPPICGFYRHIDLDELFAHLSALPP